MKLQNKVSFAVVGLAASPNVRCCLHSRTAERQIWSLGSAGTVEKHTHLARPFKVDATYDMKEYAACLAQPDGSAIYIATAQGERRAFSELHRPGVSPTWLLDAKLAGGGPLMDLGVYCVNTSCWLVDENPVEVSAQAWRHHGAGLSSVEEGIAFRVSVASGLVGQGASTCGAAPSSFVNVQGTKGWASLVPTFPFEEERWLTGKIQGRAGSSANSPEPDGI